MNSRTVLEKADVFTIPESITGSQELVILPRKIFEKLLSNSIAEERVLRLSHGAKDLRRKKKLPLLNSLSDFRK